VTETMHYFHAEDGARLAYRDQGDGPPVLALAGLTRDGRDFDYLERHMAGTRLIRLDSRGRGGSEWTGSESYTVLQEARDALALLDHLGLSRVAIIGTSRGGLIGLVIAASAKDRLAGLCLNDVGPVVERAGLERIGQYLGVRPQGTTLADIADGLAAANPGFGGVPFSRWREEAARHFVETADGIGLTYDPGLKQNFEAALAAPPADLWPLFDACAGLPLALIHGVNSDVLSAETARQMRDRRPDLLYAAVPDRGHIPFLDEPEALAAIRAWLARVSERALKLGSNPTG
jgi:pimeloyl-ACP methyl ester carboxylesterase